MKKKNNYSVILANNCNEVDFAWKKGISKKTPIFSFSPNIHLNKKYKKSFTLENRLGLYGAKNKRWVLANFSKEILPLIQKDKFLARYKIAILSALQDFQNCFIRACSLKNRDLKKKVIIMENLDFKNYNPKTISFDWKEIIPKKKREILKFRSKKNKKKIKKEFFFISLINKIKVFSREFVLFPRDIFIKMLVVKFSFLLKPFLKKGKILIFFDNTLITDSLYYLIMKGYEPIYIQVPKKTNPVINFHKKYNLKKKNKKIILQIKTILGPHIEKMLENNLCKANRKVVKKTIIKRINFWIDQWEEGYEFWNKKLDIYKKNGKVGILSNIYMFPQTTCLQEICKKKKIKIFLCRHGGAERYTDYYTHTSVDEYAKADIVFAYSYQCCYNIKDNPFKTSVAYSVGPSKTYIKYPNKFLKKRMDFIYIGSNRYVADTLANVECSDVQVAKYELSIIEKALANIPNKIFYKPYPRIERYSDPDIIKKRISDFKNIIYLDTKENVRDFYSSIKIMIMSKAASTFAWALMTDKPVVLIECPTQPFKSSLKGLLKKSVFFFDSSENEFSKKIKKFLSKKPEEIEHKYKEKLFFRNLLKNQIFNTNIKDSGKKIVNIIDNNL